MRGVVSAGMVSALEALGLTHAFDAVYGSSAGAINAAYFLAGQAPLGTTIYYEDINNLRFIDMRRAARRPADRRTSGSSSTRSRCGGSRWTWRTVLASPSPLAVLATDVTTGERVILRGVSRRREPAERAARERDDADRGRPAGRVSTDGRYFDASLTEPIPVPAAEADGHTHILVLLTRPARCDAAVTAFDRVFVLPRLRRMSPDLAAQYVERAGPYSSLLVADRRRRRPAPARPGARHPSPPPVVSKLERSAAILRSGAQAGFDAVMDVFRITDGGNGAMGQ